MDNEPTKLWNKNFLVQFQGQTVSRLGYQGFSIAMILWIQQETGSATIMGLIYAIASIPGIIFGPIGGTFADRFSRKKIIIISDLLQGAVILLIAVPLFRENLSTNFILAGLFFVAVFNSIVITFFGPAISAVIPDIVPKKSVAAANSLGQLSTQITVFLGQGLGGVLFRLLGAPILFLISSFTFLYAAISQVFVDIPQVIPERVGSWKEQFRVFGKDLVEGFRYIKKRPGLRDTVIVSAILAFFSAPVAILLPFFVEDYLRVQIDWYGYILAIFSVGTLSGFIFAGAIKMPASTRGKIMLIFMLAEAIGYSFFAFVRNPYLALVLAFFSGLAQGYILVNVTTILQITTPQEIRGRIFGILATISSSLTPVAMGLAGFVTDLVDQNIPLIFIGSSVIMTAVVLVISLNPNFREFLAADGEIKTEEPILATGPSI